MVDAVFMVPRNLLFVGKGRSRSWIEAGRLGTLSYLVVIMWECPAARHYKPRRTL